MGQEGATRLGSVTNGFDTDLAPSMDPHPELGFGCR